jgi:outer membrane receptor for ferrienterochelin and colicins
VTARSSTRLSARHVVLCGSVPSPRLGLRLSIPELALAAIAFGATASQAQSSAPESPPAPTLLQRVEVTGAQLGDDRKDATAAKFVLKRDDIARFGDTSLGDVLKRIPGVTVSGTGSQLREIRLRGLGGGYTQILVNGEQVPAGFSLDSLSPDLIERIEVLRSATVDTSTQSIAGSINIVLRRAAPPGQRSVKVGVSAYEGLPSGTVTGQYSDRSGATSFSATGNVNFERNRWPSTTNLNAQDSSGQPLMARRTNTTDEGKRVTVGFTPRLTWKPNEAQSLSLDALLEGSRFTSDAREVRTVLYGPGPALPSHAIRIVNEITQARATANWRSPVGAGGRIDAKVTAALFRRASDGQLQGFDATQSELLFRTVDSRLQDGSVTASGKYSLGLVEGHTLGAGWDGQYSRRAEDRVQRETSSVGYPILNLDEDYDAVVTRVGLFAQDEWTVTSNLSAYFGLRWEGLQTRTLGNALTPVKKQSSVYSPTAQLLWKIPDTKSDQLRVSLARTYKAPIARDLIPRRWVVNDNTPTSPNFQGNPNLVPELAWGLDIGYERYLSPDGFLGLNLYGRRIDNVIVQRIYEDGGTWVSTPDNSGSAHVFGIELEAKGKLKQVLNGAPDIDIRSGLTRNWSKIDSVPGPGNRLKDQPLFTATLGADYRLPGNAFTVGGSFAFERTGFFRSSGTQSTSKDDRRTLDFYGLWTIDKATRLRATLTNLLKQDGVERSTYADGSLTQEQSFILPSFRTIRVLFETNL